MNILKSSLVASVMAFSSISAQNSSMSFELLRANMSALPQENICVSPISLQMAMGMVNNGACGKTQTQILQALGWKDSSIKSVNKQQLALLKSLSSNDQITIELANSVWINNQCDKVSKSFKKNNVKYFDAKIQSEAFDNATLKNINQWCSNKTHGRIDQILSDINASAQLYVINALYFKGAWMSRFMTQATVNETFHAVDGDVDVPMMRQQSHFNYAENADMQLVELPFKSGKGQQEYVMYIVLPKSGKDLNSLINGIDSKVWSQWTKGIAKQEDVKLRMPKFKLEYSTVLNKSLQKMGIVDAFMASKANFSNICKSPLFIDMVLQKTFLEVSEEGAEAAAVTAIAMTRSAMPRPHDVKVMNVDKPFLFVIAEKNKENILFVGKIENPIN